MLGDFHHIGVATKDLAASLKFYEDLGYRRTISCHDPVQKAEIVILEKKGSPLIELVAPEGPESPASSWTRKNGTGPYHTCYAVTNLNEAIGFLEQRKIVPILGPVPAIAFAGKEVVFLWGEACGLVELLQL